jgi:hypothetical protein
MCLGANRFHNLINGGTRISLGDGEALLFKALSNQVYKQEARIVLFKLFNPVLGEQPVHAGKMPKFAFHFSNILAYSDSTALT